MHIPDAWREIYRKARCSSWRVTFTSCIFLHILKEQCNKPSQFLMVYYTHWWWNEGRYMQSGWWCNNHLEKYESQNMSPSMGRMTSQPGNDGIDSLQIPISLRHMRGWHRKLENTRVLCLNYWRCSGFMFEFHMRVVAKNDELCLFFP